MIDLKKKLLKAMSGNEKEACVEELDAWEEIYLRTGEDISKGLENLVKEYFRIDDGILLPEDEIQSEQYTEMFEEKLDEELASSKAYLKALYQEDYYLKSSVNSVANYKNVLKELSTLHQIVENVKTSSEAVKITREEIYRINEECVSEIKELENNISK